MPSRGRRLLWGALQGALETGVSMVDEARAHRRGYAEGHAAGVTAAALACRTLLNNHHPEGTDGLPGSLARDLELMVRFIDDTGRIPAQLEADGVDVAG